ncbi:MAG: hypothetical protein INQ03_04510 [Candidatus Heimdallarchaeota archaeon]|nr:hypothetical protein [Candidatus Heimdallarchaeota archaeon]
MVKAWAPGHCTLFFGVPFKFDDPSKHGSIGGGFNFEEGVITEINFSNSDQVFWNNDPISGEVTLTAIKLYEQLSGISASYIVNHQSRLPMGYGFSTSGAGAIGTLLALDVLHQTNIDKLQLYKLAHRAELIHHTGLGSVVAQVASNIELRLTQGDPEYCKMKVFQATDEVIIIYIGPLKTSEIITSDDMMVAVTKAGIEAVNKANNISHNNVAKSFLQLGHAFTRSCGLATQQVISIQDQLEKINEYDTAMAMIGETVLILPNNRERVLKWIKNHNYSYLITRISNNRPHVM